MALKDLINKVRGRSAAGPPSDLRGYGVAIAEGGFVEGRPYARPSSGSIDFDKYREMWKTDDMVRSATSYRTQAMLSVGCAIKPGGKEPNDIAAAVSLQENMEAIRGGLYAMIRNTHRSGLIHGSSYIEPCWGAVRTEEPWRGQRWYERFEPRPANTMLPYPGAHGGIDRFEQEAQMGNEKVIFDPHEIVHFTVDALDNDPHGTSPLLAAYQYWFIKKDVMWHGARVMSKFGVPILWGTYPYKFGGPAGDNPYAALNAANRAIALEFMKSLYGNNSNGVGPEGFNINQINVDTSKAVEMFQWMYLLCQRGIARSLLLPALVMELGENAGSYALGKTQTKDQFTWILEADQFDIAEMAEKSIFRPFVQWNFPPGTRTPQLEWNPYVEADRVAIRTSILEMADGGVPIPQEWALDEMGVPSAEEGAELLKGRPKPTIIQMPPGAPGEESPDEEPEEDEEEEAEMAAKGVPPLEDLFALEAAEADDANAVAFAGENLGTILTAMADDLESAEGKGPGERS